ncbi:MAG: hypothetical protein WAW91_03190 [Candidatus Nanoperiomorbaceae bacterium]
MNNFLDINLRAIAPHICKGCGCLGDTLCDSCFFDIIENKYEQCVSCGRQLSPSELAHLGNLCSRCGHTLPFSQVFVVGERRDVLLKLVGDFKYNSERESAKMLAKLLDVTIPPLAKDVLVSYITTSAPHIRSRGFDHMALVARRFAKLRGLTSIKLLGRQISDSQHDKNARERQILADKMFYLTQPHFGLPKRVLLIDDIWTTGATTTAATKLFKTAGVTNVQLAIVARQTEGGL